MAIRRTAGKCGWRCKILRPAFEGRQRQPRRNCPDSLSFTCASPPGLALPMGPTPSKSCLLVSGVELSQAAGIGSMQATVSMASKRVNPRGWILQLLLAVWLVDLVHARAEA